jgi:phage FluMu protein Com
MWSLVCSAAAACALFVPGVSDLLLYAFVRSCTLRCRHCNKQIANAVTAATTGVCPWCGAVLFDLNPARFRALTERQSPLR